MPKKKGNSMKIPETEQYTELKSHLRYQNEKILEAFSRFLALATAIVGGVYYVHINLSITDTRRHGLAFPASAALSLLGLGTIILIAINLLAWWKYRGVLTAIYPDIKDTRGFMTWIGELFMCFLIAIACTGFWFVNPLR
ncbi:MAG: hypothetical protein ACYS30_01770 [Planctomycetota bacterium]|jgi:hypothetical protein